MRPRIRGRTWRAFQRRDRTRIELRIGAGADPFCPGCGGMLEAQPSTRLAAVLPAGAGGFDLDCRACRRFHARIRHSPGSLRALRMRRLASAVLRA